MIEINGTYYAKDTIKIISKPFKSSIPNKEIYNVLVRIAFGNQSIEEWLDFNTIEQAEQSRKQLVEQLTFKQKEQ